MAWCPAVPCDGVLAAAAGRRTWLYSPQSAEGPGSFSWCQTVCFLHSFIVEAIEWTGSGDGLIVAGIEVVFWTRKNVFWEMAWKRRAEVSQTLVSATWFADGLVATAAHMLVHASEIYKMESSSQFKEECKRVTVYHNDGKSGRVRVPLCHPQPVSMIRWRPSNVTQFKKDGLHSWRDVLLTCCLDGTVRLWSEIDNGRVRKFSKDGNDQKTAKRSFHVIAVIEINQCLKGTLGTDIFIEWAVEFGNIISKSEGHSYRLSSDCSEHDQVGRCEWLISVGPCVSVTFWALHCLDDISSLRFPRVTLWKKLDLVDRRACIFQGSDLSHSKDQPILIKVAAFRCWPFGPPAVCSFLQLLPDNTVSWSQLFVPDSTSEKSLCQTIKENIDSCVAELGMNQNGHTGNIIQLAIDPYSCVTELAASLDTNNVLLFWSLSHFHSGSWNTPMSLQPVWDLLGRISLEALSTDVAYSSLKWAPSVIDEKRFILLGHADGIDGFLVKISTKEKDILCHKILTIPFTGLACGEGPPDNFFAIVSSNFGKPFASHSFLISSIWMQKFQVSSWKVVIHSGDPSDSSCIDNSGANIVTNLNEGSYTSSFEGKLYSITIEQFSSKFPDLPNCNQVTSVAVVPFDSCMLSILQNSASFRDLCNSSCIYQMATGFSNGTLKLWKISHVDSTIPHQEFLRWELVGTLTAHRGPVTAVSMSSCSGKVATISPNEQNTSTMLHIWESISLIDGGSFLLEDAISLKGSVVAMNWFDIGNGQLLLGVCMPNELRIYSEKRSDQILRKSEKAEDMHIWNCISQTHTYPVSRDFLWGPEVTPILVHEKYFSVFSQWLFKAKSEYRDDHSLTDVGKPDESLKCTLFVENDVYDTLESSEHNVNKENGSNFVASCLNMLLSKYDSDARSQLRNVLDIADEMRGSLSIHHPKALLQYLYSGNWTRVLLVLKHLVGYIKSIDSQISVPKSEKSKRFYHKIPDVSLNIIFHDTVPRDLINNGLQWGQSSLSGTSGFPSIEGNFNNTSSATSQRSEIMGLIDYFEHCNNITGLTDTEKAQFLAIIDLLGEIIDSSYASVYENLDGPGRRYFGD